MDCVVGVFMVVGSEVVNALGRALIVVWKEQGSWVSNRLDG